MIRRIHVYHDRAYGDGAARIGAAARGVLPGREVVVWDEPSALRAGLGEVEVLFVGLPPREGWSEARRLRLIQMMGAGVDLLLPSPDLPASVEIAGARGVFAAETAEWAVAALLALSRRVARVIDQMRERRFVQFASDTLAGKTACVVGMGEVGTRVARTLDALGMQVRSVRRSEGELAGALDGAQVLVVCVPRTPETEGLIGAAELARLANGAYLVNVARGGIVGEDAVVAALASGRLGGAALDVFAREPLPAESPLWEVPGLLISPHVAGLGLRYVERCAEVLAENVGRLERGEPLVRRIDRTRGY